MLTVAIVGLDAFNGAHGYRKAMRLKAMIPTIDVRGGNNLEVCIARIKSVHFTFLTVFLYN